MPNREENTVEFKAVYVCGSLFMQQALLIKRMGRLWDGQIIKT